jgi:hypothetical protein
MNSFKYTGLNIWLWYDLSVYLQLLFNVSSSRYYECLNTAHLSAQLAMFRCTIWVCTVDIVR